MTILNLYLISDSSGETVLTISKATLVQFPQIQVREHLFLLVRSIPEIDEILKLFQERPGIIIYTMGDSHVYNYFLSKCKELSIPAISPLNSIIEFISQNMNIDPLDTSPGKYKFLDKNYYNKIDSINFSINHDDGQHVENYSNADIILLGVSRTSKSPISLYLGQRGYNVANYPIIINIPIHSKLDQLTQSKKPILIGLTISLPNLVRIRKSRVSMLCSIEQSTKHQSIINHYATDTVIKNEIIYAHNIFKTLNIPIVDITNKAIEESAAEIINLYSKYLDD